jgi:hypothetical protein
MRRCSDDPEAPQQSLPSLQFKRRRYFPARALETNVLDPHERGGERLDTLAPDVTRRCFLWLKAAPLEARFIISQIDRSKANQILKH